ncbi:MAG: hypothetical protein WCH04_05080 [Gammaproteobacteria bacterium]
MKALAGFIVSGRYQAILSASLCGMLAFMLPPFSTLTNYLGAAVVSLVTLRIGVLQGLLVMVAATVVTMLFYQLMGVPPATIAVTVLLLWVPCWLISLVLRRTMSLAGAMLAAAVLGLVVLALIYAVAGDPAPWWYEHLLLIRSALEEAGLFPQGVSVDALLQDLSRLMTGVVVASLALGAVCSLLVARWWQAMLVNPGGLHSEFCSLRFPQSTGLMVLGLMIVTRFIQGPASDMSAQGALVMLVPYLFAGLAVLHGLVARQGRGKGWLIAVYALLGIIPQTALLLSGLGLVDTWVDFRRRLGGGKPES